MSPQDQENLFLLLVGGAVLFGVLAAMAYVADWLENKFPEDTRWWWGP